LRQGQFGIFTQKDIYLIFVPKYLIFPYSFSLLFDQQFCSPLSPLHRPSPSFLITPTPQSFFLKESRLSFGFSTTPQEIGILGLSLFPILLLYRRDSSLGFW
jgi:hypothetical protein